MTERVAFVSGGMGGIGTAVCRRLAAGGLKVVAGCAPGFEGKEEWLASMRGEGYAVYAAEGDVDDYDACADMMYRVRSTVGAVDILVNGAGIARDAALRRMRPSDWYAVINTNLNSVFNVTRQVIDGMIARGWGRIVNVSSVQAPKAQTGQTSHSAARAGMHGFTKALAQEVVRKGITVNTVSPGYVDTDAMHGLPSETLAQILRQIPMGRLARPDEIAGLIAYLASEEAGYVTGTNISINGGLSME
jgi:acetoacetyl-CoA reductase